MNRDLNEAEKHALESLMDSTNLNAILQALSEICEEKADHIQASYAVSRGVDPLAKQWRSAAGVCGVAACDKHVSAISL